MEAVGQHWRKSSRSGNGGAECVEVSAGSGTVAVRDSKDASGPVLTVSTDEWTSFLTQVRIARTS